jgi:hypothetical protein
MSRRQQINLGALLATLAVNWLANSLPFNNKTTGEVSANVPTLFTPAGYTFAIWGVIYLALLAFAIYQALPAQRDAAFQTRIGWWFAANCLFNSLWLFLWHYEQFSLTLVAMAGLLATLIAIYTRLEIGRRPVPLREKLLVHLPFSLYLAWICVASIANVSVTLSALQWDGWGLSPVVWAVLLLVLAAALAITMMRQRSEIAFPLVIAWALVGIAVRQSATLPVAIVAGLAALIVLIVSGISRLRQGDIFPPGMASS